MQVLALCQSTEDGGPLPQDLDERFRRLMGNAQEITSMEQLQEFAVSFDRLPRNTQAVLVSRRILNRIDPGINVFFLRLCIQRSIIFFGLGQYTHMFDVSIFVAELLDSLPLENLNNFRFLTFHSFVWMALALHSMSLIPLNDPERIALSIENLLRAIRSTSVLIYKHQLLRLEGRLTPDPIPPADVIISWGLTGSIFDMIRTTAIMSFYLFQLADEEANRLQVKQQLFQYNQFIKENPGVVSLLHLAVRGGWSPINKIQLLLETGADPNSVDVYGNTPLHLLAFYYRCEDRRAVTKLLLDAGCHFDQVNWNGETALSLSKMPRPDVQAQPFSEIAPSLFCICAQVIAKNSIPFEHEQIPTAVMSDVQLHVAECQFSCWFSDYFNVTLL